jgi:uncharacterized protein
MLTKLIVKIGLYLYKTVSSTLLSPRCRFHPSCSDYFAEAIITFGFIRGVMLGINRILKCHPWHEGGMDPLPKKINNKKE